MNILLPAWLCFWSFCAPPPTEPSLATLLAGEDSDSCNVLLERAMRAWDDHITHLNDGKPLTIPGELWRYEEWEKAKQHCWRIQP